MVKNQEPEVLRTLMKRHGEGQRMMGDVPVLPPGDPLSANPTEEDLALTRRMLAEGKKPEDIHKAGNPVLGMWMLNILVEREMKKLGL